MGDQRSVLQLPIDGGLTCLRGLSLRRTRFEVEYALERGSCHNSFLFNSSDAGKPAVLVHPPGATFTEPFLASLNELLKPEQPLQVVQGNVNPCLLYTSPSPRDQRGSRMPSSA